MSTHRSDRPAEDLVPLRRAACSPGASPEDRRLARLLSLLYPPLPLPPCRWEVFEALARRALGGLR